MKEFLLLAKQKHTALSVYTDREETDRFSVGYVLGVSDEDLLMALISPSGRYDGYALLKLDQIYRFNECGMYERKIVGLYEREAHKHAFFPIDEANLLGSLLAFSKQKGYIVSIELIDDEDAVQGLYDDRSGSVVTLLGVTDFGEHDGRIYVYADEIDRIFCDGEEEQTIKRLMALE